MVDRRDNELGRRLDSGIDYAANGEELGRNHARMEETRAAREPGMFDGFSIPNFLKELSNIFHAFAPLFTGNMAEFDRRANALWGHHMGRNAPNKPADPTDVIFRDDTANSDNDANEGVTPREVRPDYLRYVESTDAEHVVASASGPPTGDTADSLGLKSDRLNEASADFGRQYAQARGNVDPSNPELSLTERFAHAGAPDSTASEGETYKFPAPEGFGQKIA